MKVSQQIKLLSELPPDELIASVIWVKDDIEKMLGKTLTDEQWRACVDIYMNTENEPDWYWIADRATGE